MKMLLVVISNSLPTCLYVYMHLDFDFVFLVGVTLKSCIDMVAQARKKGLTKPVVLMGYYNPFLAYGLDKLMEDSKNAGVDGFIVVDLPPEEGASFVKIASSKGLTYVPLVSPTTTNDRIEYLSKTTSSFMYCVSVTGVTGARGALPADLKEFLQRIRAHSKVPLAVGFGIGTPDQVNEVVIFVLQNEKK